MFQTGLVSITFRQLAPTEVVDLVARAELQAIEWGGDVHVPHGELQVAREVSAFTKKANLEVAAYGSYYRVGHSEDDGLSFESVLHTAQELEAPVIRVWTGKHNAEDADEAYRHRVTDELHRICEMAAAAGIAVATEFHRGTLTNSADSTRQLLQDVNHPNLRTLWQPRVDATVSGAKADLEMLLPWLAHLHVFQWSGTQRRPLKEGADAWREYFALTESEGKQTAALIEFVQNDEPAHFLEDAKTLRSWLGS